MKKAKEENPFNNLTTEQAAELAHLEGSYGGIETIVMKHKDGSTSASFLKRISLNTKKAIFKMLTIDPNAVIEAGEMILLECWVGGVNLYENEDTRLEAALQAINLFEVNDSIQLLKKS